MPLASKVNKKPYVVPIFILCFFLGLTVLSFNAMVKYSHNQLKWEYTGVIDALSISFAHLIQLRGAVDLQTEIDSIANRDKRIIRLSYIGQKADGNYYHLASSWPSRIGKPAHKEDLDVISGGVPLILEETVDGDKFYDITYPVRDDAGAIIGCIGYTAKSNPKFNWFLIGGHFTASVLLFMVMLFHFQRHTKKMTLIIEERKLAEESLLKAHSKLEMQVKERTAELTNANAGMLAEITERKQAEASLIENEAKFRSIFQSAVVGMIVVIDSNGEIKEWNTGSELAFGYTESEAIGKPLTMLMPERYRDAHINGFAHALEQGELSQKGVTHEVSGLRKNGEEFPLELTLGSWKRNGDIYFSAIILDITKRKQTEQALRRAQKMDAIGQLAGGIAHDFNNILGIILGNLSLLERMVAGDEKALKRVKSADKAAMRAVDLTKQLLGFSRKQAQKISPTNINQVIQGMDSLISRSITPEVEIEHNLANDLWFTEIDTGDFEDALFNLILNARDAMPSGGRLTIETSNKTINAALTERYPTVAQGEYVEFVVSDTGSGISKEDLDHIFEPFFTTKPHGKGTGLGMSMVFGFIQRSNGHIRIYSEPEIGTTIRCYLPHSSGIAIEDSLPIQGESQPPRGNELVLAVDDEEDLLNLAQQYLENLGYTVVTATSGHIALEVLVENPYIDLIFSDVIMPGGMTGYRLAEQAVAIRPGVKVLLTSGYTEKTVAHNGHARFATNILSKPYTQTELAHKVRGILDDTEGGDTI